LNDLDKSRRDIAHQIRLAALAMSRLATEIERPVRERKFKTVERAVVDIFAGCAPIANNPLAPEC